MHKRLLLALFVFTIFLAATHQPTIAVCLDTTDSPRVLPRYDELYAHDIQFGELIRLIKILQIDEQYGHRPKFTSTNIEFFVDYAADSEWNRFHTAWGNRNHKRARKIFRDYVNMWNH